jgi:hypothetical protein
MTNVVALKPSVEPRAMTVSQIFDAITERRKALWLDDVVMAAETADEDAEILCLTDKQREALASCLWWALQLIGTVGYPDFAKADVERAPWTPIVVIEDPEDMS